MPKIHFLRFLLIFSLFSFSACSSSVSSEQFEAYKLNHDAQYSVLENRVTKLEDKFFVFEEDQKNSDVVAEVIQSLNGTTNQVSVTPPIAPPSSNNKTATVSPAQRAYQNALELYKNKQYAQAEKAFNDFIQKHPQNKLIPNASYWLAETFYARSIFDLAIIKFQEVAIKFPTHPKAADSLLKTAFAYEKLKDAENAKFYFEQVLAQYPQKSAAVVAKNKLSTL